LCDDLGRVDMFVTAKVVYLDFARRQIVTASAGHCPLLVWQPGQPVAVPMDDSGLPLGIETNCEYQQVVAPFPAGTTALIYTDGITEAASGDGGMFGYDRLAQLMPKLAATAGSADKLGQALRAELDVFRAGTPLTDDQTFLILHHAL